jgi:hypothetical protein
MDCFPRACPPPRAGTNLLVAADFSGPVLMRNAVQLHVTHAQAPYLPELLVYRLHILPAESARLAAGRITGLIAHRLSRCGRATAVSYAPGRVPGQYRRVAQGGKFSEQDWGISGERQHLLSNQHRGQPPRDARLRRGCERICRHCERSADGRNRVDGCGQPVTKPQGKEGRKSAHWDERSEQTHSPAPAESGS